MSYTQLLYHIVFRPKDSVPAIAIEHEQLLYHYIWGIIKSKGGLLYRIGGMPDHIHILVQIPPTIALSDFVRDIKANSSRFLRTNKDKFPLFEAWERSFCAVTHAYADKDKVKNYIKNQKQHHNAVSLRDEIVTFLTDDNIPFDPKYLFGEEKPL